jgi:hypothetical protein
MSLPERDRALLLPYRRAPARRLRFGISPWRRYVRRPRRGKRSALLPWALRAPPPPIPAGVAEYFLPQNFSLPEAFKAAAKTMPADAKLEGVVYRPALLASAQVRFLDRKYGVDSEIVCAALVPSPERRGTVRWEDFPYAGPSLDKVDTSPGASSRFDSIDAPLSDGKLMTALQKDFADWVYRSSSVTAGE